MKSALDKVEDLMKKTKRAIVPWREIHNKKYIGEGKLGVVFSGIIDGRPRALKVIKKEYLYQNEERVREKFY